MIARDPSRSTTEYPEKEKGFRFTRKKIKLPTVQCHLKGKPRSKKGGARFTSETKFTAETERRIMLGPAKEEKVCLQQTRQYEGDHALRKKKRGYRSPYQKKGRD